MSEPCNKIQLSNFRSGGLETEIREARLRVWTGAEEGQWTFWTKPMRTGSSLTGAAEKNLRRRICGKNL